MDAETIKALAQFGFPAVLCVWLMYRIDKSFVPAFQKHSDAAESMAASVKTMASLRERLDEGIFSAQSDHADIVATIKEASEDDQERVERLAKALASHAESSAQEHQRTQRLAREILEVVNEGRTRRIERAEP